MARSKRYQELKTKITAKKVYPLEEAVKAVKETANTKFNGSVELHMRLGIDVTKSEQQIRGTVTLPHGSGKTLKVAVFANEAGQKAAQAAGATIVGGLELMKQIKTDNKIPFDIAVATPEMMKDLAQIAKILGPKGLMPSPKNETVTKDPAQAVSELMKGKISFKNDTTGNVHMIIGKTSFSFEQLLANAQIAIDAVRKVKPASSKGTYLRTISLNASMGPGIPVAISL